MKSSSLIKVLVPVLVVGAGLIFWLGSSNTDSSVASNSYGKVRRQDLIQRVTISGQVYPKRRLDVKTPYTGYVRKLYVKIGERVKAGDPLITFSPSLGEGETNYPIRAAFNGVVTQVQSQEGEYLMNGSPAIVVRVDDLSELYVQASVPELDVAKIRVGQEAKIKISSLLGEIFKGVITETALAAVDKGDDRWGSSSSEYKIKVLIEAKESKLLPGMSALLDVITNKAENALVLSHEYIQQDDGRYFVTLASGEQKDITLGLQTEEAVEVKSGLNEGDRVRVIDFMSLPMGESEGGGRGRPGGRGRR